MMLPKDYVTVAQRIQELYGDDPRRAVDIWTIEQLAINDGVPHINPWGKKYFKCCAALDSAIRFALEL